ncbi:hypothetical protein PAXINDRAFT_7012 [Paxillus involutus ATCC 200175]|nr:hypothetical protein PAXINDRAFT_7012 [Paxillus involutus ATCC 200175]
MSYDVPILRSHITHSPHEKWAFLPHVPALSGPWSWYPVQHCLLRSSHTHMVAHVTNTEPRELIDAIIQLGDADVFKDHITALQIQIQREPKPFPTLRFTREMDVIDGFEYGDIKVEGCDPHPTMPMKMSV